MPRAGQRSGRRELSARDPTRAGNTRSSHGPSTAQAGGGQVLKNKLLCINETRGSVTMMRGTHCMKLNFKPANKETQ